MTPPGYAAPNPAVNCTINAATNAVPVLAKLGIIVTSTVIQTGEGAGGIQSGVYQTPAEAELLGASPALDAMYLQFKVEGVEPYQEAATIIRLLNQGTTEALMQLFAGIYPYPNTAQMALSAAASLPSVVAAIKAEMAVKV
jgi:hypothetical protein